MSDLLDLLTRMSGAIEHGCRPQSGQRGPVGAVADRRAFDGHIAYYRDKLSSNFAGRVLVLRLLLSFRRGFHLISLGLVITVHIITYNFLFNDMLHFGLLRKIRLLI